MPWLDLHCPFRKRLARVRDWCPTGSIPAWRNRETRVAHTTATPCPAPSSCLSPAFRQSSPTEKHLFASCSCPSYCDSLVSRHSFAGTGLVVATADTPESAGGASERVEGHEVAAQRVRLAVAAAAAAAAAVLAPASSPLRHAPRPQVRHTHHRPPHVACFCFDIRCEFLDGAWAQSTPWFQVARVPVAVPRYSSSPRPRCWSSPRYQSARARQPRYGETVALSRSGFVSLPRPLLVIYKLCLVY